MRIPLLVGVGWLVLGCLVALPAEGQRRPLVPLFVFHEKDGPGPADRAAPISLTASDGTGLEMVALEAHGVVESPLAFTELRMTFRNPENRVMEGRFSITLPPGASISRFAMKIGDRWQEGEVVERQAARVAYEDFLHRKQDPALLEHEGGNEFSARVFPIPARAEKELILSYSHELPGASDAYVIPLVGLPKLEKMDLRVLVGRSRTTGARTTLGGTSSAFETIEVQRRDWKPDRDFEVSHEAAKDRLGLRSGNLVVARVTPEIHSEPETLSSLYLLVDASASRALGFEEQIRTVQSIIEGLARGAGSGTPIGVALFDQEVELIYEGGAGGFGERHVRQMLARRALGASNLHRALTWLDGRLGAKRFKAKNPRVLLVTDGVATAGPLEGDALREAVAALGDRGVQRMDVLSVGGIRDDELLKRLATAGLPSDGAVIDSRLPLAQIGRKLSQATRSNVQVAVAGARWIWPERLDGVQPGDSVLVYAELPEGRDLRITVDGRRVRDAGRVDHVEKPLLERAWVRARIARLTDQRDTVASNDPDLRAALAKQVTELSVKHRVLSPYTALLVLETEHDYRRFNIDRRALTDILTVGPSGVTVLQRGPESIAAAPPPRTTVRKSLRNFGAGSAPSVEAEEVPQEPLPRGGPQVGDAASGVQAQAALPPARARREAAAPPVEDSFSALGEEPAHMQDRVAQRGLVQTLESERRVMPRPPPPSPRKPAPTEPWEGRFATVMKQLQGGRHDAGLKEALAWRDAEPGDVLALVALGEAFEATRDLKQAARAYGSLIDLFPSRTDLRRFAGQRLERIERAEALELAMDTYARAVEQRPDHPSSHRLYAFALLRNGRPAEAFEAILTGMRQQYPSGRFLGVDRILREDLGLIAAAWIRAEPKRRDAIEKAVRQAGTAIDDQPSVRFVLYWETDANDVDFHIHDGRGAHAFYRQPALPSGGRLYADVTTGYGPECFTVDRAASNRAYPYRLEAHYYSRGPMGYGMGKLQVIEHDGKGGLAFEERPFLIMRDGATVDLGVVKGPLAI